MENAVADTGEHERGRWTLALGIVAAVVLLDQLTKLWAVARLADGPISIVGDSIDLRLTRNPGAAFSIFRSGTPILAVLAVVVAIFLVRAMRSTSDRLTLVALALVFGGAVGNLLDRVFRAPGFLSGHVVDFVRVGSFPVFNVADSAITIGAILLVIATLRAEARRARST